MSTPVRTELTGSEPEVRFGFPSWLAGTESAKLFSLLLIQTLRSNRWWGIGSQPCTIEILFQNPGLRLAQSHLSWASGGEPADLIPKLHLVLSLFVSLCLSIKLLNLFLLIEFSSNSIKYIIAHKVGIQKNVALVEPREAGQYYTGNDNSILYYRGSSIKGRAKYLLVQLLRSTYCTAWYSFLLKCIKLQKPFLNRGLIYLLHENPYPARQRTPQHPRENHVCSSSCWFQTSLQAVTGTGVSQAGEPSLDLCFLYAFALQIQWK